MATLDAIVGLCKRRGFVYPTSEIYGGLTSSYDYGPLGVELLRNIKNLWWREFIYQRDDIVGLDSQTILHPQTWVASGHVGAFADAVVEDKVTHRRFRADHLIEQWIAQQRDDTFVDVVVEDFTIEQMADFIARHGVRSPDDNPVTPPKKFNLLFETRLGVVEGDKDVAYLRGETAQGIFTNFTNVIQTMRVHLPFGIGQIGKSFRNEITTGQFVFRTLEFEQAEIEYFFDPKENNWQELFKNWQNDMWEFVTKTLGVDAHSVRWREHSDAERSHYSKQTFDLDYHFPFGWKELWGLAYRTDYDLKQHAAFSGQSLEYQDPASGRSFVPHVIEPAAGVNRLFLMVLADAYRTDGKRIYLSLKPQLAPYIVAVFPLLANKPDLLVVAQEVYRLLQEADIKTVWDDRGNIGKRYFAQDEIGTPWCVTVDFDTLSDQTVTIRDRDTATQHRVAIDKLRQYFNNEMRP